MRESEREAVKRVMGGREREREMRLFRYNRPERIAHNCRGVFIVHASAVVVARNTPPGCGVMTV